MLHSPMNRIWPSFIRVARSNTERQVVGLMKGSSPSITSINANAPNSTSHIPDDSPKVYFFAGTATTAGAPRMAWKNSLPGSTIITSDLLRKLERYASRLR